jgi:ZIP family zinc transporter
LRWLAVDALAPVAGVASTYLFTLSEVHLGIVLALFCGFFLYIGASDLLPESHHRHPKALTGLMNIAGATVIWLAIHFAAL